MTLIRFSHISPWEAFLIVSVIEYFCISCLSAFNGKVSLPFGTTLVFYTGRKCLLMRPFLPAVSLAIVSVVLNNTSIVGLIFL